MSFAGWCQDLMLLRTAEPLPPPMSVARSPCDEAATVGTTIKREVTGSAERPSGLGGRHCSG